MSQFPEVEAGERAPQRLRRKALDLADEAMASLDQVGSEGHKGIHDVRRRLKELRSLADLLGSALPQGGRRHRDFFRDAGRRFASARDAKAAVEAFDRLRERYTAEWTPRQFMKIRRALSLRVEPNADPQVVEQLRGDLAAERSQIAAWPVDEMKRDALWRAIARSYRRARRAMEAALERPSPDLLHEWRRRAKVHWHHAQFFSEMGLARLESHADSLRKLSRKLGDYHDLVIIDELCRWSPELFGSPRYVKRFRTFLARQMKELESEAESMGQEIFAERARVWHERVRFAAASPEARPRMGPRKAQLRPAGRSPAITA